jgi:hypothetical protein
VERLAFGTGVRPIDIIGQIDVSLPVHDADLYYRLPGRLPAINYATVTDGEIWPDPDSADSAFMSSNKAGATFNYHVQVDKPGTYIVQLSVKGAGGTFTLMQDDRPLATFRVHDGDHFWTTQSATVILKPGPQTISLQADHPQQSLAWIELHPR